MPRARFNVKFETKGAIFNKAKSGAAAQRVVTGMNELLAQEGVKRVKARLGQVLQNPTGFYESNIQVDRGTQYRGISDNGVVYGGWLEGVDARNKTTRFKGYRTFRIVRESINRDKTMIVAPAVQRFIQEMNNG